MITTHRLYKHSSEKMPEVTDNSVHIGITSPPYNTNKAYGMSEKLNPNGQEITREKNADARPWSKYLGIKKRVTSEMYRILVPGGRFCVNIGDLGRYKKIGDQEYHLIPLHMVWWMIGVSAGFIFEGTFIWNKKNGENSGAAGSWRSNTRPIIQDVHEYILVFGKPNPERNGKPIMDRDPSQPQFTMSKREFLDLRKSVMTFNTKTHPNHPAVYPDELPAHLIKFYTVPGQTVVDPFAGAGTTAKVAKIMDRHSISFEIEEEYWPLIEDVTLQRTLCEFIETWLVQQPTPAAGSE